MPVSRIAIVLTHFIAFEFRNDLFKSLYRPSIVLYVRSVFRLSLGLLTSLLPVTTVGILPDGATGASTRCMRPAKNVFRHSP